MGADRKKACRMTDRATLALRLADTIARRRALADAALQAQKRNEREESDRLWYASQALFRDSEELARVYARDYGDEVRGEVEAPPASVAGGVVDP
jgi:hypothetical protein